MNVSVVIRAFNEERHIGRLLVGLLQQSKAAVEVIVVDSGSSDATVAIAERLGASVVRISPQDFSFGRALNRGCEAASGDVLVFASAHVYPVRSDWIEQLLRPFVDPRVELVYGRQVGNDRTKFSERQIFSKWFPTTSNLDQRGPFCNNANCAVRRSAWDGTRYDEALTGLEDLKFANEVLKKGGRIAYAAQAEIVHVHEETARRIFNRYQREAIAYKDIFPDQTMSIPELSWLVISNIACDWIHAFRQQCLLSNVFSIPMFRAMQFLGAYQGFRKKDSVTAELRHRFYYPLTPRQSPGGDSPSENPPINYDDLMALETVSL